VSPGLSTRANRHEVDANMTATTHKTNRKIFFISLANLAKNNDFIRQKTV